ncbi:hypothetical protein [Paracoccus sp. NSM]|uniref:hypothetical protein n=1 Tax=Paracoccus sp. NSM TaxID=3457784 RepID=UPI00403547C3
MTFDEIWHIAAPFYEHVPADENGVSYLGLNFRSAPRGTPSSRLRKGYSAGGSGHPIVASHGRELLKDYFRDNPEAQDRLCRMMAEVGLIEVTA